MTVGNSALVDSFIMAKATAKKPEFEVVVVEGTPYSKVCIEVKCTPFISPAYKERNIRLLFYFC
jgi:hypothetical protein